jgi:hypothetical protein
VVRATATLPFREAASVDDGGRGSGASAQGSLMSEESVATSDVVI